MAALGLRKHGLQQALGSLAVMARQQQRQRLAETPLA